MKLQIECKVIAVNPVYSGVSKLGNQWSKQEFIVETMDQYPRKVCVQVMGDKIDKFAHLIQVNNVLEIDFDVESREYNGRWFTNVTAYEMRSLGSIVSPSESPFAEPNDMDKQAKDYFDNYPESRTSALNPENNQQDGDLPF